MPPRGPLAPTPPVRLCNVASSPSMAMNQPIGSSPLLPLPPLTTPTPTIPMATACPTPGNSNTSPPSTIRKLPKPPLQICPPFACTVQPEIVTKPGHEVMSISELRTEYNLTGLRRKDLQADPLIQSHRWFNQAAAARASGRFRRLFVNLYK